MSSLEKMLEKRCCTLGLFTRASVLMLRRIILDTVTKSGRSIEEILREATNVPAAKRRHEMTWAENALKNGRSVDQWNFNSMCYFIRDVCGSTCHGVHPDVTRNVEELMALSDKLYYSAAPSIDEYDQYAKNIEYLVKESCKTLNNQTLMDKVEEEIAKIKYFLTERECELIRKEWDDMWQDKTTCAMLLDQIVAKEDGTSKCSTPSTKLSSSGKKQTTPSGRSIPAVGGIAKYFTSLKDYFTPNKAPKIENEQQEGNNVKSGELLPTAFQLDQTERDNSTDHHKNKETKSVACPIDGCSDVFNSKTEINNHLMSKAHLAASVICPWCFGEENYINRIGDLKSHHAKKHVGEKVPETFFLKKVGFYLAKHPDLYIKWCNTPSPYNSSVAKCARECVKVWCEKSKRQSIDTWEKGWLRALSAEGQIISTDEHSFVTTVSLTDAKMAAGDNLTENTNMACESLHDVNIGAEKSTEKKNMASSSLPNVNIVDKTLMENQCLTTPTYRPGMSSAKRSLFDNDVTPKSREESSSQSPGIKCEMELTDQPEHTEKPRTVECLIDGCGEKFTSTQERKRHWMSKSHKFASVICPWCFTGENSVIKIGDLKAHHSNKHKEAHVETKDTFFGSRNGFYLAKFPEYYKMVITPAPSDSREANEAKTLVRKWCEKTGNSIDKWEKGWRKAITGNGSDLLECPRNAGEHKTDAVEVNIRGERKSTIARGSTDERITGTLNDRCNVTVLDNKIKKDITDKLFTDTRIETDCNADLAKNVAETQPTEEKSSSQSPGIKCEMELTDQPEPTEKPRTVECSIDGCGEKFTSTQERKRHWMSKSHKFASVICPWCYTGENSLIRIGDLKTHHSNKHKDVHVETKDTFFARRNGFYLAKFPEYYNMVITPAPSDSREAYEAKELVRKWCEKTGQSIEKWEKGWRKAITGNEPDLSELPRNAGEHKTDAAEVDTRGERKNTIARGSTDERIIETLYDRKNVTVLDIEIKKDITDKLFTDTRIETDCKAELAKNVAGTQSTEEKSLNAPTTASGSAQNPDHQSKPSTETRHACWKMCGQIYSSQKEMMNHMRSKTHGISRVICPWCFEKETTQINIGALRHHISIHHRNVDVGNLSGFFREKNAFYLAVNPDDQKRFKYPTPYNSQEATSAMKYVTEWLDKCIVSTKSRDEWERGWSSVKAEESNAKAFGKVAAIKRPAEVGLSGQMPKAKKQKLVRQIPKAKKPKLGPAFDDSKFNICKVRYGESFIFPRVKRLLDHWFSKKEYEVFIVTPFIDELGLELVCNSMLKHRKTAHLAGLYVRSNVTQQNIPISKLRKSYLQNAKESDKNFIENDIYSRINDIDSGKVRFHAKFMAGVRGDEAEVVITSANFTKQHFVTTNLETIVMQKMSKAEFIEDMLNPISDKRDWRILICLWCTKMEKTGMEALKKHCFSAHKPDTKDLDPKFFDEENAHLFAKYQDTYQQRSTPVKINKKIAEEVKCLRKLRQELIRKEVELEDTNIEFIDATQQ